MTRYALKISSFITSLFLLLSSQLVFAAVADTVFINGRIYTMNAAQPWAEAMAIRGERIVWLGKDSATANWIDEQADVIDLKGRLVLPGLHDVHTHVLEGGSFVGGNCELPRDRPVTRYKRALRRCAKEAKGTGTDWVLAYGHSLHRLLEADSLPYEILDAAIADKPLAVMEETSHSIWVNSKAMELAGIDIDSEDPPGGLILRDPDTREPNGILLESAGDRVYDLALQPNAIANQINYDGLLETLAMVAKNGITSFSDARVYWRRGWMDVWRKAERERALTARVALGLWAYPHLDDTAQIRQLISMHSDNPNSLLRVNQIKMYNDGILHNTTARMLEPYKRSLPDVPQLGLSYFPEARMTRYIRELENAGFDMHIHAIGDRGVRESLNAIQTAAQANGSKGGTRHRITHVEQVAEADRSRFAKLNVIADFQLAGEFTRPENEDWMEPTIGERAFDSLPILDIYNTGATVTISSDWTVSPMSPFLGMQNALTRGDRSMPSLHSVLEAYTINGAYVMRQEQQTGSLEVGKFADLIVLDRDLFEVPVTTISKTKVLMTILAGEVVYKHRSFR